MDLSTRRAVVTGGGRGIGKAIALALARAGAHVTVTGRNADELAAVAAEASGAMVRCDLGERGETDSLVATLLAAGHVDILVNNAGVAESAPLAETADELWDRALEINTTAPFRLIRALAPAMVQAGWGRIINVASNAGLTGYGYTSAYCASKHALVGLTRALAIDLGRTGVTINALCPGWVDTQMAAEATARIAVKTGRSERDATAALVAMSPQRRLITADEVAHAALTLCAEAARGIHGQTIVIDGGAVMK